MPDLSLEQAVGGRVAGIDEAGRGPWAGPVMASAVILDYTSIPSGINDSKKLSARERERLFGLLLTSAEIGIGVCSVEEVDRLNILGATKLAMQRALANLPTPPDFALVDGNRLPALPCPAKAIIRGDSISLSIAAASIIAKVTRDRIMAELARAHPAYGWESNAGYGTRTHQEAIAACGITPHHRRSFRPIREYIERHQALQQAS